MKKKILALCLVVVLAITAVTGATLAYFTDSHSQTNTFTAGKVGILLDEAIVEPDENDDLVDTGDRTEDAQAYVLHPGIVVTKDPTITVDSGSLNAYVAAIVTVKGDLYDLVGVPGYDNIDIHALVSGGLTDNKEGTYSSLNDLTAFKANDGQYTIYQQADKANNTWTLYILLEEAMSAGEDVVLFDTLTIPADYNNAEMEKINGMSIEVDAYAVQTESFDSCLEAMTSAFGTEFAALA